MQPTDPLCRENVARKLTPIPGTLGRGTTSIDAPIVAVDFETFYDSKSKYSLRSMDPWAYVHHKNFDAYLVSIVGSNGGVFVGRPAEFCWGSLTKALLVAHNAAFDSMVLDRLIELGVVPDFPREWVCTADLSAYLCRPRDLKGAAECLLGETMSKQVRTDMDGKTLLDAVSCGMLDSLLNYAFDDALNSLRLWVEYGHLWPGVERRVSACNRESCRQGLHVDAAALSAGINALKRARDVAEAMLPWANPEDPADALPAGSRPGMAAHIRSLGLPVPESFKKDDPGMEAWVKTYGEKHPFIGARLKHASLVPHIARLESMSGLLRPDGTIPFSLKYFGAHTGRASASGDNSGKSLKFNVLNIPKDPVFGLAENLRDSVPVDLRGIIVPAPGMVFGIWDYGQIEARIVQWLAGNTAFLDLIRDIGNIYEADAVSLGLWDRSKGQLKAKDKPLYAASKERVLGLGFGMGAPKFLARCRAKKVDLGTVEWAPETLTRRQKFIVRSQAGLDPYDPKHADEIGALLAADLAVSAWRRANAAIADPETGLWAQLQRQLKLAAALKEKTCEIALPSGRIKYYFAPHERYSMRTDIDPDTGARLHRQEMRIFASPIEGRPAMALHGGVITENLVQATARDLMYEAAMEVVELTSWRFAFNAYDEVVFELPASDAGRAEALVPEILCRGKAARTWAAGLPLDVEGGIFERYMK